jgi:cytochrome P450
MVLLSLEDCVFPSNCEKKLAMRAAEVSTLGSRKIADRFDPFGAGYLADPYPTFAVARDAAPAFYSTDLDHWVVTRYADVRYVLRTTAEFSAINALEPLSKLCPHAASILKEGGYAATPALTNLDPPGHARQRRLANAAFTPNRVAALEPFIRNLAQRFCDERLRDRHADLIGVTDQAGQIPRRRALQPRLRSGFSSLRKTRCRRLVGALFTCR